MVLGEKGVFKEIFIKEKLWMACVANQCMWVATARPLCYWGAGNSRGFECPMPPCRFTGSVPICSIVIRIPNACFVFFFGGVD